MIKIEHYYYKEDESPKFIASLDWFVFEDRWTQRYMFDRAMWKDDEMETIKKKNLNRHKWFTVRLNLFNYRFHIEIKLAKVGNLYYGRIMKDEPKASPLRRKK